MYIIIKHLYQGPLVWKIHLKYGHFRTLIIQTKAKNRLFWKNFCAYPVQILSKFGKNRILGGNGPPPKLKLQTSTFKDQKISLF